MAIKNKYKSKCQKCGKPLDAGEGYCISRNRGYQIVCEEESCRLSLSGHNKKECVIEVRKHIPPLTGVIAKEPYSRSLEYHLLIELRNIFGSNWRNKTRSKDYNVKRGSDMDNFGREYVYLRGIVRNIQTKNAISKILYF